MPKRKKLLRAALALALLGGVIPLETEAYYPTEIYNSGTIVKFKFQYAFDWWDRECAGINVRSWSGRHRDVWLYFEDGFYAYKVSPGDKYLITNFVWAGSGSKLAGFSDVWTVNGNAATREFTADQTSQNGVKLRNVREHEVTFPFEIWYSVKRNIARSYLDFENSGIE